MTPLATIPAFEENNVPSGNEEPPLGAPAFSDEEGLLFLQCAVYA